MLLKKNMKNITGELNFRISIVDDFSYSCYPCSSDLHKDVQSGWCLPINLKIAISLTI